MKRNPKCLACGKTLKQVFRTVFRAATPAERQTQAELRVGYDARLKLANDMYDADEIDAAERDRQTRLAERVYYAAFGERHRMVTLRPRMTEAVESTPTGEYGYEGNGYFCSLRCGFAYGVDAARESGGVRRRVR